MKWKRTGLKQEEVSRDSKQGKAIVSGGRNQQLPWKNQNRGQKEHKVPGVENGKGRRHHQRGAEGSLESSDYQSFGHGGWGLVLDALSFLEEPALYPSVHPIPLCLTFSKFSSENA